MAAVPTTESIYINGLYGPGCQQHLVFGTRDALDKLKHAIDVQGHIASEKATKTLEELPKFAYAHLQETGDYISDDSLNQIHDKKLPTAIGVSMDDLPDAVLLHGNLMFKYLMDVMEQLWYLRGIAIHFHDVMKDTEFASEERVYDLGIVTMVWGYDRVIPRFYAQLFETKKDAEATHTIWLYRSCTWDWAIGTYLERWHGVGPPQAEVSGNENDDGEEQEEEEIFSLPPPPPARRKRTARQIAQDEEIDRTTQPSVVQRKKPARKVQNNLSSLPPLIGWNEPKSTQLTSFNNINRDLSPQQPPLWTTPKSTKLGSDNNALDFPSQSKSSGLKRKPTDPDPLDEEDDLPPPRPSRKRKPTQRASTGDAGDKTTPKKRVERKVRNTPKRKRTEAPDDLIRQTPDTILDADPDFVLQDIILRVAPHYTNTEIFRRLNVTLAAEGRPLLGDVNNIARRIVVALEIAAKKSNTTKKALRDELKKAREDNGVRRQPNRQSLQPVTDEDADLAPSTSDDAPAVSDNEW